MHDVWAIHMIITFDNGSTNIGYLGNQTTITKPDLSIKYVSYQNLSIDFENIIFFLTTRKAQHILNQILIKVNDKYNDPNVVFSIKKFNVSQTHLNLILTNSWTFENV